MAGSDVALIVAACAEVAAAGGTIFLAFKTSKLAGETKDLAGETKRAADATARAADAATAEAEATVKLTESARIDRELAWRPVVVVPNYRTATRDEAFFVPRLEIRNIGRGPALHCIFATYDKESKTPGYIRWCYRRGFHLAEGDSLVPEAVPMAAETINWSLFGPAPATITTLPWVVIYSDIFGNRYRHSGGPVEISLRGAESPPIWASIWREDQAR